MDDRTKIPLSWFLTGLCVMSSILCAGTFWVASVNNRLSVIEQKLDLMTKVAVTKQGE